jgi:K(+)-stimulated pyrophosphate-energized sodium pump
MNLTLLIPVAAGVAALLFAVYFAAFIRKQDSGTEKMKKISAAISKGARAFLFSEYKILIIFAAVLLQQSAL